MGLGLPTRKTLLDFLHFMFNETEFRCVVLQNTTGDFFFKGGFHCQKSDERK